MGTPIVGKVATFSCPKGYYSKTKAAACELDSEWTSTVADCTICDHDGPFDICGASFESCADIAKASAFTSAFFLEKLD